MKTDKYSVTLYGLKRQKNGKLYSDDEESSGNGKSVHISIETIGLKLTNKDRNFLNKLADELKDRLHDGWDKPNMEKDSVKSFQPCPNCGGDAYEENIKSHCEDCGFESH